jgi:hypothetical protein
MTYTRDQRGIRGRIRVLWEEGFDTAEIAQSMQLPEHLVERQLHVALEIKRSIKGQLSPIVEGCAMTEITSGRAPFSTRAAFTAWRRHSGHMGERR